MEKEKMKYSKDRNPHPVPDLSQTYDYLKSSSVTDCTGVVPSPPQNSAELDSYLEVYNFLPQSAYTRPNGVEIDMFTDKAGNSSRKNSSNP